MECPQCKVALAISDRQGIEVDYCPQCRGVWLDRGELDKILERSSQLELDDDRDDRERREDRTRHRDGRPYGDDRHYREHGYRRRKSWWMELFD